MLKINKNTKPLFISFEGGEGCGKTTQLELLPAILKQAGIDAKFTREPGGTPEGEEIRELLLKGTLDKWSVEEELMLHSTARSKHVREVITPTLKKGKWLISDRFADSTTVYQGYVQGCDMSFIEAIHNIAVRGFWPDLTIVLDIPVKLGLTRKGVQVGDGLDEDRYENHGEKFHRKVRDGFLDLAKQNPNRIKVVDATGTIETVQSKIIETINQAVAEKQEESAA